MSRTLWRALLLLGLLVLVPYLISPVYDFPDPVVFQGREYLNPYTKLGGQWQRANLHAHGRAWGGVTNGDQSSLEVARWYADRGYSVPGVSNYHSIAAQRGVPTLPLYEHGYNVLKHHQLAIGARTVDWFDFPLWQSLSNQQYVIDRVGRTADLVALAHPPSRNAYLPSELRELTGYHLIEVVNGPFHLTAAWDAALSSGHAVWAIANDDTHDLREPGRAAVAWNMIDAPTASTADIVAALRAGRSYAVSRRSEAPAADIALESVKLVDGTLAVSWTGAPATVTFVGQDGVERHRRDVETAGEAQYTFAPNDTYIRTVIESDTTTIFLNPVLRYDGVSVPKLTATVDAAGTWLSRGGISAGVIAIAMLLWRRSVATLPTDERLLTEADRNPA